MRRPPNPELRASAPARRSSSAVERRKDVLAIAIAIQFIGRDVEMQRF